jgi:hypothetical protein
MSRQFVHGWNPDSEQKKIKDFNARIVLDRIIAKTPALPASGSLRSQVLSILNQGSIGSCTTQAVAQALRMALVRTGIADPELVARLFLYYYARAMSPGDTQVDSGTQIRCVFDVVRTLGCCPERLWPHDTDNFTFMPSADAMRAAYDQRSSAGYFRITSTGTQRIVDICTAIAGGHAVVFGTCVSNSIFNANCEKPLGPPIGETIIGGHAMTVTGYTPGLAHGSVNFDIVGSWGADYGTNGYIALTDTYLAWSETSDLWIVDTAPNFAAAA